MLHRIVLIKIGLIVMAMAAAAQGIDRAEVERLAASIRGTTIIVDWHGTWDYETIQEALDVADDGDTIVVLPSTGSPGGGYVENIVFPAEAITLRSINPQDPAIVDATVIRAADWGSVVTFSSGTPSDAAIDGFTIAYGDAEYGGGIHCVSASPNIFHCVVGMNSATFGGAGIFCEGGSTPTIWNCLIHDNYGGGLACDNSSPVVVDCLLVGN